MTHRTEPSATLVVLTWRTTNRPTKLITMKRSSHQSLAAEMRRDTKRKATVIVLRIRKVILKPMRPAAVPIMVKHGRWKDVNQQREIEMAPY
jgi:hypothetical protein